MAEPRYTGFPYSPESRVRAGTMSAAAKGRKQGNRPHPTTGEPAYTSDEEEFMFAMQEFKRASGRQFPTWSEALRVLRSLGYSKPAAAAREAS